MTEIGQDVLERLRKDMDTLCLYLGPGVTEDEHGNAILRVREGFRALISAYKAQEKKYKLLQDAVNENDSPCLSTCDSYAHAEDCPHVDMAKALERQQERIEAQAKEIEHLKDRVENLLHRMTSEEAAKEIERLRGIIAAFEQPDDGPDKGLPALVDEARNIREEEGRDGKA
jgi:hypothetical protein